ncbi:WecB/TagA/CpsF family glycosyltransferase [Vibrio jasicida]|uniref:WecB/TagA/CpsF family glycosyltransferase n=1 Tax=Vibrio jasicida TaxID=766224 RepID=UPI000CE3299A|nr:WecB/TagA/CpsF family glycosyltransferase [Vibrio jasicida]
MPRNIIKKVIHAQNIENDLNMVLSSPPILNQDAKLVSFVNPYSYMLLRNRLEEHSDVDVFYSDALVSCWWFSAFSGKKIPRISFDYGSFAKTFLDKLDGSEHSVYFVGAKDKEIQGTIASFRQKYPSLRIAGFRHGYFDNDEEKYAVIQEIADSGATFVICGMGTPHQERFGRMIKKINSNVQRIYTCGGFLHQSSGNVQYYPNWVNKYNLRWLYRAVKEDYVLKRLLVQYPQFAIYSTMDYLFERKKK